MEANLAITDLLQYDEDVLFLVVLDHKYGKQLPVQIGTQVIDHLVTTMRKNCNMLGKLGNRYTSAM